MRYAKVDRRVWLDERFRALSDDGRYLWLALLTHPNLTSLGTLRSTWPALASELGWPERRLRVAAAPIVAAGMVEVNEGACYVALPNFLRYNQPESPNVCKAWIGALELVPECEERRRLLARCGQALAELKGSKPEAFREAFEQAFRKAFGRPFAEAFAEASGSNRETFPESVAVAVTEAVTEGPPQTPRKRGEPDGRPWLDCLNRETGSGFKHTDGNLRPIRERIREGHSLEDCEVVVKAKAREWTGTSQAQYLRPSTLFGTKFDAYLQAARNGHGSSRDVNAAWRGVESGEVRL